VEFVLTFCRNPKYTKYYLASRQTGDL